MPAFADGLFDLFGQGAPLAAESTGLDRGEDHAIASRILARLGFFVSDGAQAQIVHGTIIPEA
jgi:hypothetical protein